MNRRTDIERLDRELKFILGLWLEQRKTFSLLKSLSTHHDYVKELQKHTDLFALMQNRLTETIILDLCKMFEYNPKMASVFQICIYKRRKYLRNNILMKIKKSYG